MRRGPQSHHRLHMNERLKLGSRKADRNGAWWVVHDTQMCRSPASRLLLKPPQRRTTELRVPTLLADTRTCGGAAQLTAFRLPFTAIRPGSSNRAVATFELPSI